MRDNGPGVAADLRDTIFEPFFTPKARGGGLGLPIARRTAELHGGTLTLTSPPEGGAVFTLTLPLHALPEPAHTCGSVPRIPDTALDAPAGFRA